MSKILCIGNVICDTSCTCISDYSWPIQNFWMCINATGDALLSPQFLAANDIKPVVWCTLMFYPKGKTEESKDYFSLFVKIKTNYAEIQKIRLSLYSRDQFLLKRQEFNEPTQNDTSLWGDEKFFERSSIVVCKSVFNSQSRCTKDSKKEAVQIENIRNSLTIKLKITVQKIEGIKVLRVLQSYKIIGNYHRDLAQLVDNEAFSDIELLIGKKSLRAHRYILMRGGPGFSEFIEAKIKEKPDEKRIRIPQIKYNVCLKMLRYIYSGKVEDFDDIAADLIMAAHKYNLPGLKRECEWILNQNVNMDNVMERLQLAFSCDSNSLKFTTIGFVIENRDILRQPNYRNLPAQISNEISKARTNSFLSKS